MRVSVHVGKGRPVAGLAGIQFECLRTLENLAVQATKFGKHLKEK